MTGYHARSSWTRITRIGTIAALIGGAFTTSASLAPSANATPPTPVRVDLVSSTAIGPTSQADYQTRAEPGDAIQNVYYVTGACTPQSGHANCDPPNGNGQGVAGDDGAPVTNASLSITVDHGFFTPNCTAGGVSNYAQCTFSSPPVAGGGIVGNLANSGTTQTVTTDGSGEFVVTLGIGRDAAFDQLGLVNAHVTVGGLATDSPGDRSVGTACPESSTVDPVIGAATPGGTGGCPVDVQWTTMEQPLNGGTAHLIGIPPISNSSSHAVPTENNALVADSGINNIPDVERVDFMVYLTDQFGNLASWVPGGELPTLTISGPGSLYRCTGSSSTSACTGGTVLSSGSAVAGSYLDPDWQVRYQADTNNGSINLRYPCGATESGCVAANTATPGINDGTQTDTLQWSPPTTTFAAYVPGPPNIATYSAGTASAVTDSYSLSFYDQLATMSLAAPDAIVGVTETVTAVVANWDGTPVANKTVRFFVQGADTTTGSATTNSNGVARFTFLPAHPGSDNIQAFTDFDGDQVRELAEPDVSTDITVTSATVPSAPTSVSAVTGNGQAAVSWAAPSSDGGSPITGYDVQYSTNNGTTWTSASATFHTSTATSQTVTGLTNGTAYLFRVAAINSVGTGPYSAASAAVTPAAVPEAPTAVTATAGNLQATVTWMAPSATGGLPITGYDVQYSSNNGTSWTSASSAFHTSAATTETVTGLTNGTAYVFRVAAISSAGTGAYSAASAAVTPASVPGAPTAVTATAGDASAVVSWTAPADTGGERLTAYTVQDSSDGGTTWNGAATGPTSAAPTAPATTLTVTGLANGTAYEFRVAATNSAGTGAFSTPSAPVTPAADSSHLTIGASRTIDSRQVVTISTRLTDSTTHLAIPNAVLALEVRHAGSTWHVAHHATTDSSGEADIVLAPISDTDYKWMFAGDGEHASGTSETETVTARQVVSSDLTAHRIASGQTVEVYGTVTPDASDRNVALQRHAHGNWVTIARAILTHQKLPDGRTALGYILPFTGHGAGTVKLRVHIGPTRRNAAGTSRTLRVRVK